MNERPTIVVTLQPEGDHQQTVLALRLLLKRLLRGHKLRCVAITRTEPDPVSIEK